MLILFNTVQICSIFVKFVIAQFIQNPDCNEQTASQTDSESRNIDKRKSFMSPYVP